MNGNGISKLVFKDTIIRGTKVAAIGVELDGVIIYEFTQRSFSGTAMRDLEKEILLYGRDPFGYMEMTQLSNLINKREFYKDINIMDVDINLNEVVEKPPLHQMGPGPYTFLIQKTSLEQSKNPNARTGNREWNVVCTLVPEEHPTYSARHSFSLSPGALESSSAAFSIKKFFTLVGFQWGADGKFNSEAMIGIRFKSTVKMGTEPQYTNLDTIIGPA